MREPFEEVICVNDLRKSFGEIIWKRDLGKQLGKIHGIEEIIWETGLKR